MGRFSFTATAASPLDYLFPEPSNLVVAETLYPSATRTRTDFGGTGAAEGSTNTFAGTHDGSDSTKDAASATADTLTYGVSYVVGASATPRPIYAVRVKMRVKSTGTGFVSSTIDILHNSNIITVSPVTLFMDATNTTEYTTLTNITFTFRTDESSVMWTNASAAGTWGFLFATNATGATAAEVSEFYIELLSLDPGAPSLLVIDSLVIGLKSTSAITPVVTVCSGPVAAPTATLFKYRKKLVASTAECHPFDFSGGLPCWDASDTTAAPARSVELNITAAGGTITYTATCTYHYEKPSRRTR